MANNTELAARLVALGCPAAKSEEMAAQLDKRAHQLALQKNKSHDEALTHLLNLMQQGWAAAARPSASATSAQVVPTIKPWPTISSKHLGDFRVFSVRSDVKSSPRTGAEHEFFVLDSVNWVNVVALTPEQQMVMVRQYRQGTNTVELEIPGGVMEPHDASPVATGCRELREETGYEGEGARIIGQVFPNPAIMSNTCFTVLVENCRLVGSVEFDSGEDLITYLVPVDEVPALVAAGQIRHSLVVAALYHFALL
jgi:8-oxo-dGTP pyrophosphatase MutT (NUDIX family)